MFKRHIKQCEEALNNKLRAFREAANEEQSFTLDRIVQVVELKPIKNGVRMFLKLSELGLSNSIRASCHCPLKQFNKVMNMRPAELTLYLHSQLANSLRVVIEHLDLDFLRSFMLESFAHSELMITTFEKAWSQAGDHGRRMNLVLSWLLPSGSKLEIDLLGQLLAHINVYEVKGGAL